MLKPVTSAVLGILAATVGWVVGEAAPRTRPAFVALVAVLVVVEATVTRTALGEGDGGRGWMAFEAFGLLAGVGLLHLLTAGDVGSSPGRLVDIETVTGWVVGGVVWGLTHATLHDVDLLGYPGDGPGEPSPMELIRARFVRFGFVLVVAGSVAAVGVGGMLDTDRAPVVGPLVPVLVYFAVGLAALGRVGLRHEEYRWRRDGARIDPDVADRWNVTVLVVVSAVLVAGLAVPPRLSGMGGLTPTLTRVVASFGRSTVDWMQGLGDRDSHRAGSVTPPGSARTVPAGGTRRAHRGGDLVRDVSVLLVLAAGLGLAFMRFERRRRYWGRGRAGSVLGALWRLVRDGLAALGRALLRLFRGAGSTGGRVDADGEDDPIGGGESGGWVPPDDVRRRVIAEYRTFLVEVAPLIGARRPSETSGEYERRVAGRLADTGPVRRLTRVFDVARYSRRRLGPATAEEAAAAHADVRMQLGEQGSGSR